MSDLNENLPKNKGKGKGRGSKAKSGTRVILVDPPTVKEGGAGGAGRPEDRQEASGTPDSVGNSSPPFAGPSDKSKTSKSGQFP